MCPMSFQCILNDPNYGPLMDNIKRYPLQLFQTDNLQTTKLKFTDRVYFRMPNDTKLQIAGVQLDLQKGWLRKCFGWLLQ